MNDKDSTADVAVQSNLERGLMMRGELELKEPHPAARSAMQWLDALGREQLSVYLAAFSSCAIKGNRLAEICGETLRRVLHNEPVSDRYLLGLVWTLREHGQAEQDVLIRALIETASGNTKPFSEIRKTLRKKKRNAARS